MTWARAAALFVGGCSLALPVGARAEESAPSAPLLDRAAFHETPRPPRVIGIAELNLGWAVLPVAEICGDGQCSRGDSSPLADVWSLVRFHQNWAVGAGLMVAPFATTNLPVQSGGGVERVHSRGYMTLEATGRYYFMPDGTLEPWLGAGLGLVVMNDNFVSANAQTDVSLSGSPGVTLRSEGFSAFGAAGLSFFRAGHIHLGATARAGLWQFAQTPETSPFDDKASLTGSQLFVVLGLTVALHADL